MQLRRLIILAACMILLSNAVSAKKVLFYEVGTSDKYRIEKGYAEFAQTLRNNGYTVASLTRGELQKETLGNYDILVVQELGKPFTTEEISSIIWFVLQQGKGLLINGGGEGKANQLSIPFGVTVDAGLLIDTSNQIGTDRNSFTLNRFNEDGELKALRMGVTKVGFYKGNGFILSGNSKCVLYGDDDTYSDTGSFPAGSSPCVAAASLFGNGLVFVLSDADLLSDTYLKDNNNRNFGLNIMDWLNIASTPSLENQTTQGLQLLIGSCNLERLKQNSTIEQLQTEKSTLETQNQQLRDQFAEATQRIYDLENQMIGPFSKSNWAIIILGLCIILSAIIYSKKKREGKPAEDDVLGELGYELEAGKAAGGSQQAGQAAGKKEDDDLKDLGI